MPPSRSRPPYEENANSRELTARFQLPSDPVSFERWDETDLLHEGVASEGIWCVNSAGRLALKKPGNPRVAGSHEAIREFLAANIASWVGVPIPRVQLYEDLRIGACSLSWKISETALRYESVMLLPTHAVLRPTAQAVLPQYIGRVVVLDAMIGAEDRANQGNHVYLELSGSWVALDYGFSFNSDLKVIGVGGPDREYTEEYLSDIREAARLSRTAILETIKAVEAIPDEALAQLLDLVPPLFASPEIKEQVLQFLIDRKARIRHIVDRWWTKMRLPGSLAEWLAAHDPNS